MTTQTTSKTTNTTLHLERDSFQDIQPFPDDIATAPLLRISLPLLRNSPAESQRLFQACKDLGFFYLDLRDDSVGESVLGEADRLFDLSKELFGLGREKLNKFDYSEQGSYYGYKGFGQGVVDSKGSKDRNEFYNSSKDDFFEQSLTPFAHPPLLNERSDLLKAYMKNAHLIIDLILSELNKHLRLPDGTLSKIHDQNRISGDHVRMIKAPPQDLSNLGPSMGAHTDFGSVTVLMNRVGGLQVLLPDSPDTEWTYVRPLPGHCIINLGDAMVKFSNGLLRSNIHRVVSPPGLQASETRYSLVYFCRPADEVLLKRLDGGIVPPLADGEVEEIVNSKDWIRDKALSRRTAGFGKVGFGKNRETGRLAQEGK